MHGRSVRQHSHDSIVDGLQGQSLPYLTSPLHAVTMPCLGMWAPWSAADGCERIAWLRLDDHGSFINIRDMHVVHGQWAAVSAEQGRYLADAALAMLLQQLTRS